jgi:hypothetical protein
MMLFKISMNEFRKNYENLRKSEDQEELMGT